MSDDGMSTDRGTGGATDVCNAAGSSSSSARHSMAAGFAGSGRDVTAGSTGNEGPPKKKGKNKGRSCNQRQDAASRRRRAENV